MKSFTKTIKAVLASLVIAPAMATSTFAADRSLWLDDGEEKYISGYFYSGELIYGDCDEDCYDLDLFLYDSDGDLVDADELTDAYPIVEAPHDGYFTIKVDMYDCSHSAGCAVEVSSDYGF